MNGTVLGVVLSLALTTDASGAPGESAKLARRDSNAVIELAVRARLAVGRVRSITLPGEPAMTPAYAICLGFDDGQEVPERLLKRFKSPYLVVKLADCEREGLTAEDVLMIGSVGRYGSDEAHVPLRGLGTSSIYVVRRERGRWRVIGPIGGIVGTAPAPPPQPALGTQKVLPDGRPGRADALIGAMTAASQLRAPGCTRPSDP